MNNIARGEKRTCISCGTKFFDFNKDEIICPKCGTEFKIKKHFQLATKTKDAGNTRKNNFTDPPYQTDELEESDENDLESSIEDDMENDSETTTIVDIEK